MSTPVRVGAFVAALAVLFGAAFGIGRLFDDEPTTYLLKAAYQADGGTLTLDIADADGAVPAGYEVRHEKELHLIAVRTDFGGYRHLHPTRDDDGSWSLADADLSAGRWRLYADFQPAGGEPLVVSDDLTVPGEVTVPVREVSSEATVDGYQVSAVTGADSMLEFRVSRRDALVTLEPYLGAYGHLVAIRQSDLEYLHVHPEKSAPTDPIPFHVEVPTSGRYHLYLDFQVDGVVRTAHFLLDLEGADAQGDHGEVSHGDH